VPFVPFVPFVDLVADPRSPVPGPRPQGVTRPVSSPDRFCQTKAQYGILKIASALSVKPVNRLQRNDLQCVAGLQLRRGTPVALVSVDRRRLIDGGDVKSY